MKRVLSCLSVLTCCILASLGQIHSTDTLFSINNTSYSSQEFLQFCKHQSQANPEFKNRTPEKALDDYIVFQLKLNKAIQKEIHKLPEVKKEIQIYKDIALNSFLYPTIVSEDKIIEAFQRIQHYIKVRHILVKLNKRSRPQDTLAAYQKAQEIRKKLINGKSFEKLARKKSDDLSVGRNNGELGYFTAFDMNYSFENAIYKLKKGEYSMPIRTEFGYHIAQVIDKIPNLGKLRLRHILLDPNNEESAISIDSLQQLLHQGEKFEYLAAKYSLDSRSAQSGGLLPWIGQFETHPEIEKAAFQLREINEVSEPIKTEFGIHLLQLAGKKDYSSFEKCKNEIIRLIANDNRSKRTHNELIHFIKRKYNFTEKRELLSNFYSVIDYAYAELEESLFSIDGKNYSQEDFANYLSLQPSKDIYETFTEYVNRMYDNFSNNSIFAYYKKKLLNENLELKRLTKFYTDELLVIHYTKNRLNSLRIKNEDILNYYQKNKNRYKFKTEQKKIIADYKKQLQLNWEKQLLDNNIVEISQKVFSKIIQERNE